MASADTLAGDPTLASARARGLRAGVEAGERIGRYLVLRTLGAGGMGVVLAAYDPKLDRKVALKLLRRIEAGDTDLARKRLEREAQALAKLAHPNVVGVHDVEVHEGQLFVAMELVDGETLGAWIGQPRSWREVLSKFIDAGRGLAAAHAAGLIHRDFKPDNVMIGGDGRVRVMDFGLARGGDAGREGVEVTAGSERPVASLTSQTMTQTGAMMGTPAYMAPEHFVGKADARSDQFGFCVALYEGLYGQRPFAGDTLAALLGAVSSGQIEPPPRGTAVPAWLRAVVVRGLAPDPDRRWPSMEALLVALADDPALRRRRWGAALLVAGLIAGAGASVVWATQQQAQVCRGFEAQLAGVWDDASKAKIRARFEGTGLSFAADTWTRVEARLDDYTSRWVAARRGACESHQRGEQSGELLDLRMRCLNERLRHVEATATILSAANEDVVRKAVKAVAGLPSLDRCADEDALRAAIPPPEDPKVAERVAALDEQLIEARALRRIGEFERGRELATRVVDEAKTLDHEPLQARAWLVAGFFESALGRYSEAEALFERAHASALGLGMREEAAEATAELVIVVGDQQARHEAARGWAKIAEPLARAVGTPEARTHYLNNMGNALFAEGKYEEARAHHERALAIREAALGPDHPSVASSLNNLGNVASVEGRYEEARAHLERALAIWERALGPGHPDLADSLSNLGVVAGREGKHEESRAYFERGLAIRERALGPGHPTVADSLNNLGIAVVLAGRYEEARAYFERALTIWEETLGPDHPDVATSLDNLGGMMATLGKNEEARAYFERSLAIREKSQGADHPDVAVALTNLGGAASAQGKYEEARAYFERALRIEEKALGPDHPDLAYALTGLGEALLALDAPAAAVVHLERSLSARGARGQGGRELAGTRFALAQALWDAPPEAGRDRPRALELAALAAAAYESAGDEDGEALAQVRAWLAAHAL